MKGSRKAVLHAKGAGLGGIPAPGVVTATKPMWTAAAVTLIAINSGIDLTGGWFK